MNEWWKPNGDRKNIKPFPWLSPKATEFLESLLTSDMNVIEHGSGGSTLWFARRVRGVFAVEQNEKWREAVTNVLNSYPADVFLSAERDPATIDRQFDLLLIDGEPVEARKGWITNAPRIVHPGGWVVLDNANRKEYAAEREWLKQQAVDVVTIDGNEGPTQFLVTEFFKMPDVVAEAQEPKPVEPEPVAVEPTEPAKKRAKRNRKGGE